MYTLEQLRMLVAAAEQGSFSAAARRLGKAQSVVSQGIANLEIDLDLTLFDRSGRSPVLTPEGHSLYEQASLLMLHHARLESSVRSLGAGEESELVIAMDEGVMLPGLERKLAEFARLFPDTNLQFLTVASPDVEALIREGPAQLGVMFSQVPYSAELDASYIGSLPFQAVVSPDHPLAGDRVQDLASLSVHRQLLVKGIRGGLMSDLPRVSGRVWWANNLFMVAEMACRGFGWAYIPAHLADDPAFRQRLVPLKLDIDSQAWKAPVDLVTRPGQVTGPALAWLQSQLRGIFSG